MWERAKRHGVTAPHKLSLWSESHFDLLRSDGSPIQCNSSLNKGKIYITLKTKHRYITTVGTLLNTVLI